jgi:hypothetical protein
MPASRPRTDARLLRVARFSSSKDEVVRKQKQSRSHVISEVAVDAVTAGGGVSRPEWRRRAQWPGSGRLQLIPAACAPLHP